MLLIFSNTFYIDHHMIGIIDIYVNFGVALIIFYLKKILRIIFLCIILITALLDGFKSELPSFDISGWHETTYFIFFLFVSKKVLYTKTVTRELLAAALCDFVLLCLMVTFVFYVIEIWQPHSFTNIGEERMMLMNLDYFSFTTLLTIGFGDIVPVTLWQKGRLCSWACCGIFTRCL